MQDLELFGPLLQGQDLHGCKQWWADLDMRENTGRKSLGEQSRDQIKSVVGEYFHLPPKAYLQKLVHILSKK